MTINEYHQPVFYLVCGYYMCTLNKLPYVQELCIPIETMQDHPYLSSRYSQRVIISSVNPSDSTNGGLFLCIVSTSTYSSWIMVMRLSVSPCLNSSVQCLLICRNLGSSFLMNSGHLDCSRSKDDIDQMESIKNNRVYHYLKTRIGDKDQKLALKTPEQELYKLTHPDPK